MIQGLDLTVHFHHIHIHQIIGDLAAKGSCIHDQGTAQSSRYHNEAFHAGQIPINTFLNQPAQHDS